MKPKLITFNLQKHATYEPIPASGIEVVVANIPYRRCVAHHFINHDLTFDTSLWVVSDWATGGAISEACNTKAAAIKSAFEKCEKYISYLPELFGRYPVLNCEEHVIELPVNEEKLKEVITNKAQLHSDFITKITLQVSELNDKSVNEMLKLLKPIDKR